MNPGLWRWIVALLVTANIVLAVIHIRGDVVQAPPEPETAPLDPGLPTLTLVGERPTFSHSGAGECFMLGPLPTLLAQQRAEDRLRPAARRMRSRQTVTDRDRGWWVYLPAGSRSEALSLTRNLAEQGLEDFFVVTRGDMENVVSVGLYESIENARARQRQVRTTGFDAQLEIRRESVPQFWVDYEAEPGVDSAWRFIIEGAPGAQHRPIPCFETDENPS
ncbi:MAG: SPOR domain-containing protein [Wenzhouxiangella sp.]|nr:MAG: SPOR domain-containing protein [Wenzhouxiangella sp.]